MKKINILSSFLGLGAILCGCAGNSQHKAEEGEFTIDIYATNDIHGRYMDSLYTSSETRTSLLAVNEFMNGVRAEYGEDKVVLIDAGDCLQGDNASYYYNYVDTGTRHIFSRMAEYMRYDAVVVGNHDIETGHPVYDRIRREMSVPFLAANAIRDDDGKAYFQEYTILHKNGLKVAVIGFTNPNIKRWLSPEIWSGMSFTDLMECAQATIDRVNEAEHPDVVIAATHSGTGTGDGSSLESQGLDLLHSLRGVDFILCAHDHKPCVERTDSCVLLNSGSHCRYLSHGRITVSLKDGKIVSKDLSGDLVTMEKDKVDTLMREEFKADFEAVKAFTLQEVGRLAMPLDTRDAYTGMSDYMNLIHTICLGCAPARLSFAAPLTFSGYVREGTLNFDDLFTIYPYENQLFIVRMRGRQIQDYLEYSYDKWIKTVTSKDKPVPYNLDSMAGANYTVDVTKAFGERVSITTMADGSDFDPEADYDVAMTSYRASGGGFMLRDCAGIDSVDELVVERYPEIRQLLYEYLLNHVDGDGSMIPVTRDEISRPDVIGSWKFVPEDIAGPLLEKDMSLLFPKR